MLHFQPTFFELIVSVKLNLPLFVKKKYIGLILIQHLLKL